MATLISYLFVKIVKIYSSFLQGAHEMEEVHFLQSWEQWVSDHQPLVEPPVRLNHHHQLEVWKSLPLESKCIRSLWTLSLSPHPKISSFDYTSCVNSLSILICGIWQIIVVVPIYSSQLLPCSVNFFPRSYGICQMKKFYISGNMQDKLQLYLAISWNRDDDKTSHNFFRCIRPLKKIPIECPKVSSPIKFIC